jgi:hypothetical protein
MGRPQMGSSFTARTEPIELQALGGVLRFGSASELEIYIENASTDTGKRRIRTMRRSSTLIIDEVKPTSSTRTETPAGHSNDAFIAGATAMTDIDNIINELQTPRDYLQAEAERLWRANARYANLAKAASDSAKSITDSMGQWRNTEFLSASSSLNPHKDSEAQREALEG